MVNQIYIYIYIYPVLIASINKGYTDMFEYLSIYFKQSLAPLKQMQTYYTNFLVFCTSSAMIYYLHLYHWVKRVRMGKIELIFSHIKKLVSRFCSFAFSILTFFCFTISTFPSLAALWSAHTPDESRAYISRLFFPNSSLTFAKSLPWAAEWKDSISD